MYKTTLKIDGMMCSMCENHMNEAIRNAFDVDKVTSSHSKGESVIISKEALNEDSLKTAVEKTGY
ncbi:MAG: ATPase P, partial [Clostridia bacterium]|nr:ATPase P [Clostridia bacterium]